MLPGSTMASWHLDIRAYPYILATLPLVYIFFISGTQIRIAVLICSVLIIYGKITSEAMRVIWAVYSLLFSFAGLRSLFGGFVNNCTQSVGGKVGDDFSQPFTSFFLFRYGMSPFENILFPLDVKDTIFFFLNSANSPPYSLEHV